VPDVVDEPIGTAPLAHEVVGATFAARVRPVALPIASTVLFLVLWQAIVKVYRIPSALLPPPTEVGRALVDSRSLLLEHAWPTTFETVLGFFLGAGAGIGFAIAITYSRTIREALYPLLVVFQIAPKFALAPLFIVWLGIGSSSRLAFALFITFFPITISTAAGLTHVDRYMVRLARSLTATEWQVFTTIRLPSALPHMFSGLKVGITLALIGVIVGEFITAQAGLGYLIIFLSSRAETASILAAIVVLCGIGLVLYGLLTIAERVVLDRYHGDR
jgi:NitT/TauT family transport system permease protein